MEKFITSDSTKNLAKALLEAKKTMGNVVAYDSKNPHFKSRFASLEATLDKSVSHLLDNGVIIPQFPSGKSLIVRVEHVETGEFYQTEFDLSPVKNDPQALGSALTYARRYVIQAICGLSGGEDDDAESAMPERNAPKTPEKSGRTPKVIADEFISKYGKDKTVYANALKESWDELMRETNSIADRKTLASLLNAHKNSEKNKSEL